jgi:S1-C subfamily serine protease
LSAQGVPDILNISVIGFGLTERSRRATVKIYSVYGEGTHVGTGTLFRYQGKTVVITAAHVVSHEPEDINISSGGYDLETKIVYLDEDADLAVLLVTNGVRPHSLCFKTLKQSSFRIGLKTIYSGYPNNESLLTIKGYVSGTLTDGNIYLHSYGWPGASGSAVLDERGKVIGVLSAVSIGQGIFGMPSVIEDSIIVVPIWKLDMDILEESLNQPEG